VNAIASTDLWFVDDEIGWPNGSHPSDQGPPPTYDPLRYLVWVDPGRPSDELAPRTALHLAECRNGGRS
jgi:hypothetical protein